MRLFLFIALIICASLLGCSANKQFLAPEKIPHQATKGKFISARGDTVLVRIGTNFQPTFVDSKGVELKSDFTIKSMTYKSQSGNELNGWLITPLLPSKNPITLLFFHGNGGNITTEYQAMIPLVEKGFQAFVFDYSGYGFSDGKATRDNLLQDGQSTVDFVRGLEEVKNTKLVIYGQSLGGHLGIVVGSKKASQIDGIVSEAAFSSHKDIAAKNVRLGFVGRLLLNEKYSAAKAIKSYHKPILIIHSTEDETIPSAMAEKLYANANEPKYLYLVKHCHACAPNFYADSLRSKIYAMLHL